LAVSRESLRGNVMDILASTGDSEEA